MASWLWEDARLELAPRWWTAICRGAGWVFLQLSVSDRAAKAIVQALKGAYSTKAPKLLTTSVSLYWKVFILQQKQPADGHNRNINTKTLTTLSQFHRNVQCIFDSTLVRGMLLLPFYYSGYNVGNIVVHLRCWCRLVMSDIFCAPPSVSYCLRLVEMITL